MEKLIVDSALSGAGDPERYVPAAGGGERAIWIWSQMVADYSWFEAKKGLAPPENWRIDLDRLLSPAEWVRGVRKYKNAQMPSMKSGHPPGLREFIAAAKDDSQERASWGRTSWQWNGLECKHTEAGEGQMCTGSQCQIFDNAAQCKYAASPKMIKEGLQTFGWRESGADDSKMWRKACSNILKRQINEGMEMPDDGGQYWKTGKHSREWCDWWNALLIEEVQKLKVNAAAPQGANRQCEHGVKGNGL